jgi:hypothetical protein
LLAVSDPNCYDCFDEGQGIVKHAQCVLLVSCPYISELLTTDWSQHMSGLIDLQRSGELKAIDLPWVKKEAQNLLDGPTEANIPRCHSLAHPILRQILEL